MLKEIHIESSVLPNWMSVEVVNELCDFALSFFGLENFDGDLEVTVTDEIDAMGYACVVDNQCELEINPNQSFEEFAKTIFHEMTHIDQELDGRLVAAQCNNHARWNGKEYDSTDYWNAPWEQEAYMLEEVMWKKYQQ